MGESELAEYTRAEDLMAKVLPVIRERHGQAWLVGGWVRDQLLGLETRDYDFLVPGGAIATARRLADVLGGAFVELDGERDAARVIVGPPSAVVYVDLTGLRAPSVEADLLGRDFTVNAMAVPVEAWREPEAATIDPAGGRRDLQLGLLRAVSVDSFRQDPLRLLRAVRLRGALGFEIEGQTAIWIERDAELIDAVSRERVRDEFGQILALPRAAESLSLLDSLGLLLQIVPELAPLRTLALGDDGRNVLEHSFQTVDEVQWMRAWLAGDEVAAPGWPHEMLVGTLEIYRLGLAADLAVVLPGGHDAGVLLTVAALLHDVGKGAPGRAGQPQEGRVLGHEVLGASLAATIMRRLCFSGAETVRVRLAVRSHMRPGQLVQESGGEPSRRAIYRFYRDAEPSGMATVLLSLADHLATRGPTLDRDHWRRHLATSAALLRAYYEQRQEIVEPPPVVDGHELMSALGLKPGPGLGVLLDSIREAQAAGEVRSRAEAIELARQLLARAVPYS